MSPQSLKSFEISDGSDAPAYTVTVRVASRRAAVDILAASQRAINKARKREPRRELPGQLRMPDL